LTCGLSLMQTTNGTVYEGLFHTYQLVGKEYNVILKHAQTLKLEGEAVDQRERKPLLLVRHKHLAELKAAEINLSGGDISAVAIREPSHFEDDGIAGIDPSCVLFCALCRCVCSKSAVSCMQACWPCGAPPFPFNLVWCAQTPYCRCSWSYEAHIGPRRPFHAIPVAVRCSKQRDLQAFVFDDSSNVVLEEWHGDATGWSGEDMFQQNRDKFGVSGTFNMDDYTVPIDPKAGGMSVAKAAEIEASILQSKTTNAHTMEERGMVDNSGLSEEDRYGAVIREGLAPEAPTRGGGVPPAVTTAVQGATQMQSVWVARGRGAARGGAAVIGQGGRESRGGRGGLEGHPHVSEERADINQMRQTLAAGKSLRSAVGLEKQQRYTNDVATVDALNLNPGTGSKHFRKGNNVEVAHQLSDYKSKRESNGAPPVLAAAPAPLVGTGDAAATAPAPATDAAPAAGNAPAADCGMAESGGESARAPSSVGGSNLQASRDTAKAFKFSFLSTTKEFKSFIPKGSPKVATPVATSTAPAAATGDSGKEGRGERREGRGGQFKGDRGCASDVNLEQDMNFSRSIEQKFQCALIFRSHAARRFALPSRRAMLSAHGSPSNDTRRGAWSLLCGRTCLRA
jgi:hypothetical protein